MFHPTVARLTYRALLGRKRALIMFVLPALLILISVVVVRVLVGADDDVTNGILGGFAVAYAALSLLVGTVTKHAVMVGLGYALIWESLVSSVIPGARTLSIQQWALAVGERIGEGGLISFDVALPTALVLLAVAGQRLRSLTLAGED